MYFETTDILNNTILGVPKNEIMELIEKKVQELKENNEI